MMLASMAEREQFRSPSAAKVRIFSEMAKDFFTFMEFFASKASKLERKTKGALGVYFFSCFSYRE